MNEKKILLIINPYAGKMRSKHALFAMIDSLSEGGHTVTVSITKHRGHATAIARNLKDGEYDIVACSGGDGTLNEVISGIIQSGTKIPIGYIPSGSTNDFATTLGLSNDIQTAARDVINGTPYPIDIGRFGDKYFSYVASFGIFTKASYATGQKAKNTLGSTAYIINGIKDIAATHDYHIKVDTGNGVIDDKFIFGAVMNSTSLGGIITIAPSDVALDDGKFEYLFIKKPHSPSELMRAVHAVTSHDYSSDRLYFGDTKKMTLIWEGSLDWSLDGEHSFAEHSIELENLHHAVSIILPCQTKQIIGS